MRFFSTTSNLNGKVGFWPENMFLLIKLLTVRYVVCAICTLLSLFSANINATTKTAVLSRAVVCTLLFGCFHLSLRLKWELSNAMAYIVYVVWPWVPFFGVLSRCPGIAAKCPGFKKNSHDLNDEIYSTLLRFFWEKSRRLPLSVHHFALNLLGFFVIIIMPEMFWIRTKGFGTLSRYAKNWVGY